MMSPPLAVMVIVTLSFGLTLERQMHSKIRLVHGRTLVCIQAGQCLVILLSYLQLMLNFFIMWLCAYMYMLLSRTLWLTK